MNFVTFISNTKNYLKLTDIKDWNAKILKDALRPEQKQQQQQQHERLSHQRT